jgi:hypothetical protein
VPLIMQSISISMVDYKRTLHGFYKLMHAYLFAIYSCPCVKRVSPSLQPPSKSGQPCIVRITNQSNVSSSYWYSFHYFCLTRYVSIEAPFVAITVCASSRVG